MTIANQVGASGLLRGRIGLQVDGQDNLVFGLKKGTTAEPVVLTAPGNNKKLCGLHAIEHLSLPDATEIESYAFSHGSLVSISAPELLRMGSSALSANAALIDVSMPKLREITAPEGSTPGSAFSSCLSLASISLPELEAVYYYMFSGCLSLASVSVPKAESVGQSGFATCTSLTSLTLPAVTTIAMRAFNNSQNLADLYLPGGTVATLENSNAFQNTPIYGSGTGKIHVPASLEATYKAATNWSTLAAHIVGDLEG